ncbi:MAG: hypothetical protein EB072_03525 [Betaproteobacteria bacterium]|nr:hypothetical protein [Betaproteobacteria bacterium]
MLHTTLHGSHTGLAFERTTIYAAKRAIMYFIGYYNTERRHSSLGNVTPAQFECRWRAENEKSAPV